MTVRRVTLTVTVKYNDAYIVQPAHLIGGIIDEIQGWGGSGQHYEVKVSQPECETEVQAARREAKLLIGISLDTAERNGDLTSVNNMVHAAIVRWTELAGLTDTFAAYMELHREVLSER